MDTLITFVPNVRNPARFEEIPLKKALIQIKKGAFREQVERVRTDYLLGDDDAYKTKKNALPSYSFNGLFEGKVINAGFKRSSGLVHFDIDKLSLKRLKEVKSLLQEDSSISFVFTSPSGYGLKTAVRIDPRIVTDDATFKAAFAEISAYWAAKGVEFDPSCKDARRVCFTSFDDTLFYNPNPTIFGLTGSTLKKAEIDPLLEGLPSDKDYSPITLEDATLPDITLANCEKYLPVAGEQSYAEWRDVGMALHHQFGGSFEALEIFDRWSQNVREYQGFDDVERTWNGFGKRKSGPVVTFKTLIQAYNTRIVKETVEVSRTASEKADRLLEKCTDYNELVTITAPKLWKLANRNVILEKDFLEAIVKRYSELRPGCVLGKTDALRAMKMKQATRTQDTGGYPDFENPNTPEWARDWVWVSGEEVFYNVTSRVALSGEGFRGHYDSYLPTGEGAPTNSGKWLRDNNLIPKVMRRLYVPSFGRTFEYEGVKYVNTYSSVYRVTVPEVITNQRYVDTFIKHLELFCGGRNREFHLFANYLAASVSEKPIKVRWAPLLIGDVGCGKSLFYTVVSNIVGYSNTKSIACSTITSSASSGQSGWSGEHLFGLIEEVKMQGHNRHDVLNNLKPYITNDVIPFKRMHKEVINIPNTVNWLLCSNYKDCAPVTKFDRRYFVLFSHLKSSDLEDPTAYYKELHEAITLGAGDIAAWLRDFPVHPDFQPNGEAPMTDAKLEIDRLTEDDLTSIAQEAIEDSTSPYYTDEVVAFDKLFVALSIGYPGLKIEKPYQLTRALLSLGYTKVGRLRVGGERHCLWAKKKGSTSPTAEWAKARLEHHLKNFVEDDLLS